MLNHNDEKSTTIINKHIGVVAPSFFIEKTRQKATKNMTRMLSKN